ncbi:MAG: zf-TFIIB domain-containing protein [Bdellovibrionales bacterium]|nr:zf-TFIIB domain-containing protein [Bdellovibrionales bacterium]
MIPLRRLSEYIQTQHVVKIADTTGPDAVVGRRKCPSCSRAMRTTTILNRVGRYELDVCRECDEVWFDTDELAQAPVTPEVIDQASRLLNGPLGFLEGLFGPGLAYRPRTANLMGISLSSRRGGPEAALVLTAQVALFLVLTGLLPDLPEGRPDPLHPKKKEKP